MPPTSSPLLVINGLALSNPYVGQGVYTGRLLHGLSQNPENNWLVVIPPDVTPPPLLPADNFVSMPMFFAPRRAVLNHAFAAHHLLRFVKTKYPDAIFHSPGPIAGLTRPRKTIVTLHDCLYRHFPNYDGRFFVRRALSRAAERFAASADLVLTDSEFSRKDLIAHAKIPAEKIEVLYPWVGNDFFEPVDEHRMQALRQRLNLPLKFWLYLGGYDYRKNVEFLLDAYAVASRRLPLPSLVLAGKIPTQRNPATCSVESALERNRLTDAEVIRPGVIPASDLPVLYRAASLFIFPSLGEGFGLPPAEAMAVGTPVLASNRMSLPEVVPNRHSLFDPGDLAALVEKLTIAERDVSQFAANFSPAFTEHHGINRYMELVSRVAKSLPRE